MPYPEMKDVENQERIRKIKINALNELDLSGDRYMLIKLTFLG